MQRKALAYLWDIRDTGGSIQAFVADASRDAFWSNLMLRAAVERQFMIIGEAVNQLGKRFPDVAKRISNCPQIVAFRNLLIHEYHRIDPQIVWDAMTTDLPRLMKEVDQILADDPDPPKA